MSDTADEFHFRGGQLLHKSKLNALRAKMQSFVAEHEGEREFKDRRREVSRGKDLSEIVVEERDERL